MQVICITYFYRRIRCELKYLSSIGKEINLEIPLVVTSERGTAQTREAVGSFWLSGVVGIIFGEAHKPSMKCFY
jgi:hypothetical protein